MVRELLDLQRSFKQDGTRAANEMNQTEKSPLDSNPTGCQPEQTLLQISDLHFGKPFVPDVAEEALQFAAAVNPDAIVVSGDLTQRARRDQFIAAKEYLARLPDVPKLVIPGNHDVPLYRVDRRLTRPHSLYQEIICDELNPVLQLDSAVIVGLDSTAPRSAISNGRIHAWQLDHCQEAFAGAPEHVVKIVVAHHHFAPAPDYLHDWTMPKSKRAMMRFVEIGVDMILGGHLHRAYIGNSLDFYPGQHPERGIIITQSGTTTSRRGRGREQEKNSLNVIRIYPRTIDITHCFYFSGHGKFVPTSRHSFLRRGVPMDSTCQSKQSESVQPALRID